MAYWYAVIYADGSADLDSLTLAQKQSIRDRYVSQAVLDSPEWAVMSAAEQWAWIKENIIPGSLKRKIAKYGVLPILYRETSGFEIFQSWWKLAQEETKFVFLVHLDYDSSMVPIKNWLDTQSGFLYWFGPTAWDAFRNLWNDRGTQPQNAILRKVIRYPVETETTGDETVPVGPGLGDGGTTMVTIGEAETLGYSIEESVLIANKNKVLPLRVYGY